MKKGVFIFVLGMLFSSLNASVTAYFNYGLFNVPGGSPFVETYLTILGSSIKFKPVNGGYQGSVNVKVSIVKSGQVIASNNYNLMSPIDKDTIKVSSFIDNQRYPLSNGIYTIEMTLSDNNDATKKSFSSKETFTVNFSPNTLSCSSIQMLESYTKSSAPSSISKSGFDLIPYNVNYYPANQNKLLFYFESYNADTTLGTNQPFVYSYYIERKEDLFKPQGCSGFKKQTSAKVNPLLAQIDISKLESGNYYLVIELRDKNNKLQLEKRLYFQRNNPVQLTQEFKTKRSVYEFFGEYNNADTLKMFVESLWPISSSTERDWGINQAIKKDPEFMKNYIVDFWQKRAGDSLDPLQMWLSYYNQVTVANVEFKCGKQKGYFTDRGRVFLQYGKPDQRVIQPSEPYSYPYEIWQYYRIEDKSNGQFYTNKKFVFVNSNIADDCFKLIHSDMRGEINNPRWQYEVSKRRNDPNIDKTKPDPLIGNNVDGFFNNPH